jgi:crotonobetainyl-CoA:carnitine CoA-transferase CaiB-like acyl-CoA transferase
MACYLLQKQGAVVTRIEEFNKRDPFYGSDPSFDLWYRTLNSGKKNLILNLSQEREREQFDRALEKAHIIIASKTAGLSHLKGPRCLIDVKASRKIRALHDLNALANSGALARHIKNQSKPTPPFLPIAGMMFAQAIAFSAVSAWTKALATNSLVQETLYLDEVTDNLLSPLLNGLSEEICLHEGKFPCYSIYRLKDGSFAALAAIEEHYWLDFQKRFSPHSPLPERFDCSNQARAQIEQLFVNLNKDELGAQLNDGTGYLSLIPSEYKYDSQD